MLDLTVERCIAAFHQNIAQTSVLLDEPAVSLAADLAAEDDQDVAGQGFPEHGHDRVARGVDDPAVELHVGPDGSEPLAAFRALPHLADETVERCTGVGLRA